MKVFYTRNTRIIRLPSGKEIMTICSVVSIEYGNATDEQTDRQTDGQTDAISISLARKCADAQ